MELIGAMFRPKLIFCLLLACLQVASVYSGCFGGGSCAKEEELAECLSKFQAVTSLVELRKFLQIIDLKYDNGLTAKNVKKCLGFDSRDGMREKITDFLFLIDESRHGRICLMDNIDKLFKLNRHLSAANGAQNKELRLAPWWQRFVKQVILKCESTLTQKMDLNRPQRSAVVSLATLANKFNWKNPDKFLDTGPDDAPAAPNADDGDKGEGGRQAGPKAGIVSELLEVTFDVDGDNELASSPTAKYDTIMSEDQLSRLQELFSRCNYIGSYKKRLIAPLMALSNLGHLDGSQLMELMISTNKYKYIYLPALKMCALLRHVTVLKLPNGLIRFKTGTGSGTLDKAAGELGAQKLDKRLYPFRLEGFFSIVYPDKLDAFEELDEELLDKVHLLATSNGGQRGQSEYAANLKRAVYSEAFLKRIVDYIETTDEFQAPIQFKPRFSNYD